ncbi:MAG: NAD(+) diphosphatase [Chitinivibrionales bacterium]|nr:NAD(+) diphosphatase [Chitinivibrionales bacterium]
MNEGPLPPVSRGIGIGSRTFIFHGNRLLVRREGVRLVPADTHEAVRLELRERSRCALENFSPIKGVAVAVAEPSALEPPYELHSLRSLLTVFDEKLATEAGTAYHLLAWDSRSRFCGACGGRTAPKAGTHGRECGECGQVFFPRLSPAAITAVLHDNRILLAHNKRFPEGVYSLIAGFVEPGESLEDCVRREVREETGVRVNRIAYFGSQPWPFPDALMIGFTAQYHSGDIVADGDEIEDARWFTADSMPRIPGPGSISRRIIDWFVQAHT